MERAQTTPSAHRDAIVAVPAVGSAARCANPADFIRALFACVRSSLCAMAVCFTILVAVSSSSDGFATVLALPCTRFHSATSISLLKMSIGTSTSTGPGRPLSASVNAFSRISGRR